MRYLPSLGAFLLLAAIAALAPPAAAQIALPAIEELESIEDLSLEDLLNGKTTVASTTAMRMRESPGVLTIVTREEIMNAGARDLIDVLRLVPGFDFGVDVYGIVGVGFRGNWAHEGKVLLLVDGQELNDPMYLTLQLGNHIPVETIERVEIIRGPGSAIYGGYAELGVINIVTRKGAEKNHVSVFGSYGQGERSFLRRNVGFSYGQGFDDGFLAGLDLSVDALIGQGQRSDGLFTDAVGTPVQMDGAFSTDPMWLNAVASFHGLTARVLFDNYRTTHQDGFGEALPKPFTVDFPSLFADVSYEWKLPANLVITPRFNWRRTLPWNNQVDDPLQREQARYDYTVDRYRGNITAMWDPFPELNLVLGTEAYLDRAEVDAGENGVDLVGYNALFEGKPEVYYSNFAAFGQMLLRNPLANVTAGARFEYHSAYGPSFVPRVALTRAFDQLHVKLLVSGAFKAPGIENIKANPDIEPERTSVFEAEVGYRFNKNLYVTVNAFDITIRQPIVYFYDEVAGADSYTNFEQTGSRGVELEARARYDWGYANLSYSLYTPADKNRVDLYAVPGQTDALLGLATHKLAVAGSYELAEGFTVTPTLVLLSERWGFLPDGAGGVALGRTPPSALLNIFLQYRNLFLPGLDVGLGAYNVLGDSYAFVQPYDGGHTPLPGAPREVMARLSYAFGL